MSFAGFQYIVCTLDHSIALARSLDRLGSITSIDDTIVLRHNSIFESQSEYKFSMEVC